MPSLTLDQVTVTRGPAVTLLKDISVSFAAQTITCLIGPSGSGKSTLLRLLNRLDDPTAGSIYYHDRPLTTYDPVIVRRTIGMMLQKPIMFAGTVRHNLLVPFTYQSTSQPPANEQMIAIMEQARLSPELLDRDARTLSLGQQQRVSLARTLISNPQVLLLDEPTSALDPPTADGLGETLATIVRNKTLTMIIVTHDLRLARQIADRIVFLDKGEIREQGGAELLNQPATEELRRFLAEPEGKTPQ